MRELVHAPANDDFRDDPDTERWCVDFLNALRFRYAEMRDQSAHGRRGDKTMELRNLLDRVYDELGEQMSPDLRNTIATELDHPTGSNKPVRLASDVGRDGDRRKRQPSTPRRDE